MLVCGTLHVAPNSAWGCLALEAQYPVAARYSAGIVSRGGSAQCECSAAHGRLTELREGRAQLIASEAPTPGSDSLESTPAGRPYVHRSS